MLLRRESPWTPVLYASFAAFATWLFVQYLQFDNHGGSFGGGGDAAGEGGNDPSWEGQMCSILTCPNTATGIYMGLPVCDEHNLSKKS